MSQILSDFKSWLNSLQPEHFTNTADSNHLDTDDTDQAIGPCEDDCRLRMSPTLLRQIEKYCKSLDSTVSKPIRAEFRSPLTCRTCQELFLDMDGLIDHLVDKPCGDECFAKLRIWEAEPEQKNNAGDSVASWCTPLQDRKKTTASEADSAPGMREIESTSNAAWSITDEHPIKKHHHFTDEDENTSNMKQENKPWFAWSVDEKGNVVRNGDEEDLVRWLTQDLINRLSFEDKTEKL